jgi:D-alanyl-lipoteichoic acid acyltransferase DltB (MBOAT superfamily)
LLGEYTAHSGVASIQIGCMRQLGYNIPERYRYPLFAHNPAEFWRRWNTYVGTWARSYVFVPLFSFLTRRVGRRRKGAGVCYAVAVVTTFSAVGLLHDAFATGARWTWKASITEWFFAIGCIVVAWERMATSWRGRRSRGWRAEIERLVFLGVAAYAAARLP